MDETEEYTLAVERLRSSLSDIFIDSLDKTMLDKLVEKEIESDAMRKHASQRDADFEMQSQMFLVKEQELAAVQQRLATLELHRERVQTTIEWMREVDKTKKDPKHMTTVSYEKPRRQTGVPLSFDKSCEFSNIESRPESLVGGRVISFRRKTLDTFADEMMEMFDKAIEYQRTHPYYRSYMAYACLHIWVGGQRRLGTRAIGIGPKNMKEDLDYLYNVEFANLIESIEQGEHFYEVVFESDAPCHVHFYFKVQYYPEPGCVANWGNVKPMENLKLFDLFTGAGDTSPCATPTCIAYGSAGKCKHSEDCILQCARRIWPLDLDSPDESRHKEAAEDTIDKLICRAEGKLVILTPRAYVRYIGGIHTYGDLAIDSLSPIKTQSVIDSDCIYLLHWKEHIGVMENMKTEIPHPFYTRFRPLQKYPNCKKLTVCFDIECYFDPHSETVHVPYLCCACFVYDDTPGNVVEFEGRDCVAKMVEWSAEIALSYNHSNVELIAHNGGGYDFHYIISSMHNPSAVYDILIRNNHFISFKFDFDDVVFSVKDSLNFLLCSLSNAAKAFLPKKDGGVQLYKTDFPHHEVRSADDLQRTFQEWIKIEQNINVNVEKERMLITVDHVMKYNESGESKRLIEWAREYCCNDTIVLAHVWVKFKQTTVDIFNCHIVDQTMTLAGLSFRLFEAHLPSGVKLFHPIKQDFMNMREALIGGRCISVNGLWHDVISLDVKSLYPAAMAFYDQPYGRYYKVKQEICDKLGIYYCKVEPYGLLSEANRQSQIDSKRHGFFPIRTTDREVTYKTSDSSQGFEAWYTSVDMEIGRSEGHIITPVPFNACDICAGQTTYTASGGMSDGPHGPTCAHGHVGYCWHNRGKIFKDYICNVLYRLKQQYEQTGNMEKRQVIKIIMNSLWGKFAQKWMDTRYEIVREEDVDLNKECYKIWDTDHMLTKTHKNKKFASKPVQNGVFTLSWARYHMKLLWDAIAKTGDTFPCPTPTCSAFGVTGTCEHSKSGAECIYSDTDSMMVRSEQIRTDSTIKIEGKTLPVIGANMGQLECEHHFDDLVCVGKKQYMGRTEGEFGPKYKFRFKGVPQNCIRPEMYAHLLEDPDNKVQIDFLKFKREWGAVHGYYESKTVTAT
jgi:hypothetical protein